MSYAYWFMGKKKDEIIFIHVSFMNTLATIVNSLKCKDITFPVVLWDVLSHPTMVQPLSRPKYCGILFLWTCRNESENVEMSLKN
jgi:hypothetical protein